MSALDYRKGFFRMCLVMCIVLLFAWYLTASSTQDLVNNAWMLIGIPVIGFIYFVFKDRVADILLAQEQSEESS